MSWRNWPEGRNDNVDQHGEKPRTPLKAPETQKSRKDLDAAKKRLDGAKEKVFDNTRAELADLRQRVISDGNLKWVQEDRTNIQERFDSGVIDDINYSDFSSKIWTINKAIDKRVSQNKEWSSQQYSSEDVIRARAKASELIGNIGMSLPPENAIGQDSLADIRGDMKELLNDNIQALSWKEQTLSTGIWTNTMNTNEVRKRTEQVAHSSGWSGGIDANSMSQPQNIKAPEMPQIKVQKIPA